MQILKTEFTSVRDPVWANEDHTSINCWVRTKHWKGEMPYNAVPNDSDESCRELFFRCAHGEFGPVGEFFPPGHPMYREYSLPYRGFVFPDDHVPTTNWYLKWPEVNDFLFEANAEIARGTIRGIGLVWGAMLEKMLKRFINSELKKVGIQKSKLRKSNGHTYNDTFSDWIDLAQNQNLISLAMKNDLDAVREIRNRCAHEWRLDFSNPKVKDLLPRFESLRAKYFPDLILLEDLEFLMKLVYGPVCSLYIICFADRQ